MYRLGEQFLSDIKMQACLFFKLEDVKPDPGAGNITSVNPRMPGNSSGGGREGSWGGALGGPAHLSAGITCWDCHRRKPRGRSQFGKAEAASRHASDNPVACRNGIWVPEIGSETQEE